MVNIIQESTGQAQKSEKAVESAEKACNECESVNEDEEKSAKEPDQLQLLQENTEKLKHFEILVEGIVDRVVKENNEHLEKHIEVTFSREMDYLVHMQEQREEERYRRLDESIRQHQNRQMVAAAKEGGWIHKLRGKKKKK